MTTNLQPIVAFLKRTYPLPCLDPRWVRECVDALIKAGREPSIENVHTEFLYSDLSMCTRESPTFPEGGLHDIIIFPRPTLLQIHAITEVGHSAYQIQTVMEQRSEVLSGRTRIRGLDDDEENEVEEGKVPPYPRGMLRLELGDGRRIVRAMEYKRINDFVLGQTSLGSKVVVQNVKVLRGILLLTPENCRFLPDSCVEELEDLQRDQFVSDLQRRLGKLGPDEEGNGLVNPPPVIPPPVRGPGVRTSKRARNAPRQPTRASAAQPIQATPQSPVPLDRHVSKRSVPSNAVADPSNSNKGQHAAVVEDDDLDGFDDFDESFLRQVDEAESRAYAIQANLVSRPAPVEVGLYESDDDDFMILDESTIRQLDYVEAQAKQRQTSSAITETKSVSTRKRRSMANEVDDLEDDEFELNESFIRQVDEAEALALASSSSTKKTARQGAASSSTTRSATTSAVTNAIKNRAVQSNKDVVWKQTFSTDISSDVEVDSQKENRVPEIIEISD
ncbi:RecQ-mediated genome instability protein 1 [Cryptococcus neoformans var. grubii Br795]|nr:RecQ-mediated genome instability protein 1 [Cryptococcus neoformans var. grubii Br795]